MQMRLEEDLKQLVERLSGAAGQNLVALVLHGSAVSDEFHPQFSDVNILGIVRELSVSTMHALSPVLSWWTGLKYAVPLFFTADELCSVVDVFPIEMVDIKLRHRLLYATTFSSSSRFPWSCTACNWSMRLGRSWFSCASITCSLRRTP